MSGFSYSADEFKDRVLQQAGNPVSQAWRNYGDALLNPDVLPHLESMALKDAAVLIPIVDAKDEARVIFTQRTTTLRKHSGQVSFPGGSIDAGDDSAENAALRETEEEIGLERRFVHVVGRLPQYLALSGFRITPVLGVVSPGYTLSLNPTEVASVFEVPLSFLMNPDNHGLGSVTWKGSERHFYEMPYDNQRIWGITASIVRMLYERLYA